MVPIVASADQLLDAIQFAQRRPSARWYVADRARALGQAELIPTDWGIPAPVVADASDGEVVDMTKDEPDAAPDAESDPTALAQGVDAALDAAMDLLQGVDVSSLPEPVAQAISLVQAAGASADALLEAIGAPDPDDDAEPDGDGDELPDDAYTDPLAASALSTDDRKKMATEGVALPDGSFPIRNASDLRKAINLRGSGTASKVKVTRHIRKRAKALGLEHMVEGLTAGVFRRGEDDLRKAAHGFSEALHPRGRDGQFILKGGRVQVVGGNGKAEVEGIVQKIEADSNGVPQVTLRTDAGQTVTAPAHSIENAPKAEAHIGPNEASSLPDLHQQSPNRTGMADSYPALAANAKNATELAEQTGAPKDHHAAADAHEVAAGSEHATATEKASHQSMATAHRQTAEGSTPPAQSVKLRQGESYNMKTGVHTDASGREITQAERDAREGKKSELVERVRGQHPEMPPTREELTAHEALGDREKQLQSDLTHPREDVRRAAEAELAGHGSESAHPDVSRREQIAERMAGERGQKRPGSKKYHEAALEAEKADEKANGSTNPQDHFDASQAHWKASELSPDTTTAGMHSSISMKHDRNGVDLQQNPTDQVTGHIEAGSASLDRAEAAAQAGRHEEALGHIDDARISSEKLHQLGKHDQANDLDVRGDDLEERIGDQPASAAPAREPFNPAGKPATVKYGYHSGVGGHGYYSSISGDMASTHHPTRTEATRYLNDRGVTDVTHVPETPQQHEKVRQQLESHAQTFHEVHSDLASRYDQHLRDHTAGGPSAKPTMHAESGNPNDHVLHGIAKSVSNKGGDESGAHDRINSILNEPDHAKAHKDLASLMSEAKLGGKQRARYREALNAHHGSDAGAPSVRDRLETARKSFSEHKADKAADMTPEEVRAANLEEAGAPKIDNATERIARESQSLRDEAKSKTDDELKAIKGDQYSHSARNAARQELARREEEKKSAAPAKRYATRPTDDGRFEVYDTRSDRPIDMPVKTQGAATGLANKRNTAHEEAQRHEESVKKMTPEEAASYRRYLEDRKTRATEQRNLRGRTQGFYSDANRDWRDAHAKAEHVDRHHPRAKEVADQLPSGDDEKTRGIRKDVARRILAGEYDKPEDIAGYRKGLMSGDRSAEHNRRLSNALDAHLHGGGSLANAHEALKPVVDQVNDERAKELGGKEDYWKGFTRNAGMSPAQEKAAREAYDKGWEESGPTKALQDARAAQTSVGSGGGSSYERAGDKAAAATEHAETTGKSTDHVAAEKAHEHAADVARYSPHDSEYEEAARHDTEARYHHDAAIRIRNGREAPAPVDGPADSKQLSGMSSAELGAEVRKTQAGTARGDAARAEVARRDAEKKATAPAVARSRPGASIEDLAKHYSRPGTGQHPNIVKLNQGNGFTEIRQRDSGIKLGEIRKLDRGGFKAYDDNNGNVGQTGGSVYKTAHEATGALMEHHIEKGTDTKQRIDANNSRAQSQLAADAAGGEKAKAREDAARAAMVERSIEAPHRAQNPADMTDEDLKAVRDAHMAAEAAARENADKQGQNWSNPNAPRFARTYREAAQAHRDVHTAATKEMTRREDAKAAASGEMTSHDRDAVNELNSELGAGRVSDAIEARRDSIIAELQSNPGARYITVKVPGGSEINVPVAYARKILGLPKA